MLYNINNFYLDGNNIVINGWATTERHQNLTGDDTHEFSLVLTNNATGATKVYVATLQYADKTDLIRRTEYNVPCTSYYSTANCYYSYTYSGFQFRIPISDLSENAEYGLKLRIYEKLIGRGFQLSFYALGVDNSYEKDGVRYQLYSDINKTAVTVSGSYLFVRSGPGQNYSRVTSYYSCPDNNVLYWYPGGYFDHILDTSQTSPGSIDSELWLKLGFDYSGCVYGKGRAINGTSNSGWAPWVYLYGSGTPATIKTTALNTVSIEELRTYTAESGTNAKALLTLSSTQTESVTINAYHNGSRVYSKNETFNGTKTFTIKYNIPNSGTLRVEVVARYKTLNISSNIYVSSNNTYEISGNNSGTITVDTPVLVVTDKNGNSTYYKEKIQLSASPYSVDIVQGRGIDGVNSSITYWYPTSEFSLNNDYNVYALYPSQESTLNYQIVNNKVKVNLVKETIRRGNSYDVSSFHNPTTYIKYIDGSLYKNKVSGSTYYDGGYIWYPPWDDETGSYEYYYVGERIGVNKITIKRKLVYNITKDMFNNENNAKFYIKRVNNPSSTNIIYKKKFTYDEFLNYLEANK